MKKIMILLLVPLLIFSGCCPSGKTDPDNGAHDAIHSNGAHDAIHSDTIPVPPETMLDTGEVIAAKIKSLAAGQETEYDTATDDIKAIHMADTLPAGFEASDANTISAEDSGHPVYIFFDDKNDAGILYVYSGDCQVVMNPDSCFAFCRNTSLSDISGLSDWDAGNVIDMTGIFMNDTSLASLDGLDNWNTGSVRIMTALFMGATALRDVSALANWDTSSAADMSFMFSDSISLTSIDVSNWNTGNVTNMNSMFQVGYSGAGNGVLSEILGLENWDVSNVTDMTCMFYGAGQMTHYDISGWDVSNVRSFNHMFCDNHMLESLDLSGWDVQNVKTMYDMFDDARKLTAIGDVSHWNTASLVDIGGWLNGAYSFAGDNGTLDLSGWNTGSLRAAGEAFRATKLETIDLYGWTFESIINDRWDGAGDGIYYEFGNQYPDVYMGMNGMFKESADLSTVYVSQSGLDSFQTAVNNGVNITDMWAGTKVSGFSVKEAP